MKRRDFLGAGLGTGLGGMVLSSASNADQAARGAAAAQVQDAGLLGGNAVAHPRDVVLTIKPVVTSIVHSDSWEGPCRPTSVPPSQEKVNNANYLKQIAEQVRQWGFDGSNGIKFLEPTQITFSEDFIIKPEEYARLAPDAKLADAFLIWTFTGLSGFQVAEHFRKPLVFCGVSTREAHIASYARAKGIEAFITTDEFRGPGSIEEFKKLLRLLRARKVFTQTKVLCFTNLGLPAQCALGAWDTADLEKRLGVVVKLVPYKVLAEEMEQVLASAPATEAAEKAADDLLRRADKSYLERKYVVNSFQYYQAVKNLMQRQGCNAFSIDCFEFCAARLPEKWKIVPCLIHTLLKDQQLGSSCENDMSAMLAMRMLMSVSNKSSHMGNCDRSQRVAGAFRVNHSVPGLKMNGFDQPDLPFQLGHFVQGGWGTKAVVDFMNNREKTVTVARVNPAATKILVMRGTLVGSDGWGKDAIGCSVHADIRPPEGKFDEFERKRADYGGHMSWVYGDYAGDIKRLAEMLKLEVELIA